ncbi:MmcQ/YjbR family DNA-binding protein [Neisseria perflava]|uniref:MmcQ/YjbR family DNA-binding protein n=1 Tax=Neisseria perflava TaxID=33053 RepID=UPI00209D5C7B|nr:MmcQ/YjbR family DNA-binding protein [Neisseria perflava]MCP1659461.1 putative DNA-binding protein (MmcQ/YjbR family) [Neisseria perflava]MCP1772300.1 putative DNA-binding protein (MmcQ/YjbR family) [Neisseria perflava]
MNRNTLFDGIAKRYGTLPDYPWAKFPEYAVFRHTDGKRKWFAVYMPVAAEKLGLHSGGTVAVLNLKCPPETVGSLRQISGILPAYHMNKAHWVSVMVETVDDDLLWYLLDNSHSLTY